MARNEAELRLVNLYGKSEVINTYGSHSDGQVNNLLERMSVIDYFEFKMSSVVDYFDIRMSV